MPTQTADLCYNTLIGLDTSIKTLPSVDHKRISQHVVSHRVHGGFAEQSRQMSTHQTEGTQQSYDSKNTRMVVCVVCKNRKRGSKVNKQCSAGMRGSQ